MQNRMNKKGFTIVELVIVIAVIAVLAAVLIPTFVSLVNKANQSSDIQAARQMNEVLAGGVDGVAPENVEDAIKILVDAGFRANDILLPVSADHQFYWYKTKNVVVLVDGDNKIVYPEEYAEVERNDTEFFSFEAAGSFIPVAPDSAEGLAGAFAGGSKDITLTADVTMNRATTVPAGTEIVVDLGGKTLTTAERDSNGSHHYAFDVEGTVTFKNGVVDARGIQVYDGGKLIIGEGATVNAVDDNGGACIWLYEGSELVIDGGTFTALNGDCDDVNDAAGVREPGIINNNGGKITINGGNFEAVSNCYAINNNSGEIVINGGNFKASRGVIAVVTGTVTVNGGTFELADDATAWLGYVNNGTIAINGGTFKGAHTFVVESTGTGSIKVAAGVTVNGEKTTETVTYKN